MPTRLLEELRVHSWYLRNICKKGVQMSMSKKNGDILYNFDFPRGMNNDHSEEMRFSEKVMTDFLT